MTKVNNSTTTRLWLTLALILGVAALIFWLVVFGDLRVKQIILEVLPIPVLKVEDQNIYAKEILRRFEDAKSLQKKESLNESAKQKIIEQIIYEKKLEILSKPLVAADIYWKDFLAPDNAKPKANPVLIRASESLAKKDALKFWFYTQKNLNREAYKKAEFIISQLLAGKDFAELASATSQDQSSMPFGGDLGPVESGSILFEFRSPLLSAKPGDVLILPSRLGLHVIKVYLKKLSPQGDDMLYLNQIYLKGANFEEWVNHETKIFHIQQIIRL